jgi:stalled ribosome rescue protein Dom34
LHEAAYAVAKPHLDADRESALDRFHALRGSGDPRAVTGVEAVLSAAQLGRVDTLLLAEDQAVRESGQEAGYDSVTGRSGDVTEGKLLDAAVTQTLQNGGRIQLLAGDASSDELVGAILRY